MEANVPLRRFSGADRLEAFERAAVLDLVGTSSPFKKGATIREEGEATNSFFLLLSGWVLSVHHLRSGSRQILDIHLPGDALGTGGMVTARATEDLQAITDVMVAEVTFTRFGQLFNDHPHLAARFMLSLEQDRIALMGRLIAVCRTSARARMAAFLLDLKDRLATLRFVDGDSFLLPLTQPQIGDALGLTPIHVNRVLSSLTEQELISRDGRKITLRDLKGLESLAVRLRRRSVYDQPWLPVAR